jgi:hypothetical protein
MLTNTETTTRATLIGHRAGHLSDVKHQPTQAHRPRLRKSRATRM